MAPILTLKLISETGDVKTSFHGAEIDGRYNGEYMPGDKWRLDCPDCEFVRIALDEALKESVVYLPDGVFEFSVPFDYERRSCYGTEAFEGDTHRVRASEMSEAEIYSERIISHNSHDRHNVPKYFPHAVANFVTREDPCFFERNAIDGVIENDGHGQYPYHSWGAGLREDIEYTVHFGTEVEASEVTLYLRADFPHDTYWKEVDVEFSDGERIHMDMK